MELYSKMLKPSSWIASHRKVLPSDDGVMGYEEVKIYFVINAKQIYRNFFLAKGNNATFQTTTIKKNLSWGGGGSVA